MNAHSNNGPGPSASQSTIPARHRRTPTERHHEMLKAEQDKLAKNRERAQRLAAEAAAAQADLQKTEERVHRIESAKPNEAVNQAIGANAEAAVKGFSIDIKTFFGDMTAKYGFHIDYQEPKMTKRGFISGKFKAELMPMLVPLGVRTQSVVARETGRFLQFYRQLGLQPNLLGKEVSLSGEEGVYVVAGLRGKGHDIVLQKAGTSESYTMAQEDFKRSFSAS